MVYDLFNMLLDSVGVFYIASCHLQTVIILLLSFFGYLCFFSCLIAAARTFNTLLNKSGENGHPSLVPLRENTFILSPLNMILIVGLSHTAFIVLRHVLFLPTAAKSLQSCPTLCDPIDGSPPGDPVPGIFQARTLEWVAIAFSNA